MKAILTDEITRVLQEPTAESLSITTLRKGDEVELGKVTRKKKDSWVHVTLANGATGYITGNTTIFAIRQVEAVGNPLDVHEAPDATSPILATIPKRTKYTARGFEKVGDEDWIAVETINGVCGFVKSGAKMRMVPEVTRGSARRMMITGGVFALIGLGMLVFMKPISGSSGDPSFITIALILLGLFQVFQGYMQYRQAVKKENKE